VEEAFPVARIHDPTNPVLWHGVATDLHTPKHRNCLDRWASRAVYEVFRARFSSAYRRLDSRLEELTEEEVPMGAFETLS
jgi:hypothetical protein